MGRNFKLGSVLVGFSFFFHAKLGTTNDNWTGLSDISYKSPFVRDLNDIKNF